MCPEGRTLQMCPHDPKHGHLGAVALHPSLPKGPLLVEEGRGKEAEQNVLTPTSPGTKI